MSGKRLYSSPCLNRASNASGCQQQCGQKGTSSCRGWAFTAPFDCGDDQNLGVCYLFSDVVAIYSATAYTVGIWDCSYSYYAETM